MQQNLTLQELHIVKNLLDEEKYRVFAGSDWPSFEDIKSFKNIPQFVLDELSKNYAFNLTIDYIEFYITNVCDLACSDCRSFNNFNFTGHYEFDFESYQPWAKLLNLEWFTILGGEPLLHPNFADWVKGLRTLWPNAWAKIDSNGTYITKVKNLHQLLVDNKYFLCINLHDQDHQNKILEDINSAFGECEKIDNTDSRIHFNSQFEFDEEGVKGHQIKYGKWLISKMGLPINLRPASNFTNMPSGYTNWNLLASGNPTKDSIYRGDPKKSHDHCLSRDCHVMLDAKIYKCSTVATMSNFLKQKNIEWPDELVHQYQPITVETYSEATAANLKGPIDQCTFCATEVMVDISNSSYGKKNKIVPILPTQ